MHRLGEKSVNMRKTTLRKEGSFQKKGGFDLWGHFFFTGNIPK